MNPPMRTMSSLVFEGSGSWKFSNESFCAKKE